MQVAMINILTIFTESQSLSANAHQQKNVC